MPTPQRACKSLCQKIRASMQRHNRCIWTSSIQNFPQNRSLHGSLALNRLNTATPTRQNVDFSYVCIITQISELRSSNPMLHCPCAFIQLNTREKMRGTSCSKCLSRTQQQLANAHGYVDTWSRANYQPTRHHETMSRQCSYG